MHFQGMVGGRVINKINVVVFLSENSKNNGNNSVYLLFFINAHLRMTIYEKKTINHYIEYTIKTGM